MRMGEILALNWNDINFLTNTIYVTKIVYFVNNTSHINTTKTRLGTRNITINQKLAEMLKDWKVKQKEKVNGKITSIKTQVVDGTTVYYLKINGKIYKIEANKNTLDKLPFLEVEQTISAETDENNFLSNINFE